MICFLDRAFCSQTACVNAGCKRNLTPELAERARQWWGEGEPPIAYSDFKDTAACVAAGGFKNGSDSDMSSTV